MIDSILKELSPLDPGPKREPAIHYVNRTFENLGDNRALHRWRAFWLDGLDANPAGIELNCYPVVKATPYGAWIDLFAYWGGYGTAQEPFRWIMGDKRTWRWVANDSGAAWAKPTRKEALRSLAVRLTRWSQRERLAVQRLNAACDVASALLTDHFSAGVFEGCKIRIGDK